MFSLVSRRLRIGFQITLTLLGLLYAAPLLIMFIISIEGEGLANYAVVLANPKLPRYFLNSTIVACATVVLVYLITLLAGYGFSKLRLYFKPILYNAILIGLMLPGIALIVPLFLMVKNFGLFDNYLALILPITAFQLPFTLVLMRNFLEDLPDELMEASYIDGCNSLQTLRYIIIPLSRPISVVIVLVAFLASWNEYFFGLVFMRSETMKVVTQAPQFFVGEYTQDTGKIFATLVLISLPIMIAYLALQKYFESGLTSGSLK
jgi:raffinose/stachyose/melibiose transport system permease protein